MGRQTTMVFCYLWGYRMMGLDLVSSPVETSHVEGSGGPPVTVVLGEVSKM